jgi:hypothetical protein
MAHAGRSGTGAQPQGAPRPSSHQVPSKTSAVAAGGSSSAATPTSAAANAMPSSSAQAPPSEGT